MHQVFLHRFMEAKQIQQAIDPSFHGGTNGWDYHNLVGRLKRLVDHGYLHLPPAQDRFTKFKEGGGSFPMVYSLGAAGARSLSEPPYSIPLERFSVNKDNRARSPQIAHTLMTTDIVTRMQEDCREHGLSFYDQSTIIQVLAREGRETLRSGTRGGQVPAFVPLTPLESALIPGRMCAIELKIHDASQAFYFFIEADTGVESVVSAKFASSTPVRKIRQYRVTAKARLMQDHFPHIGNFIVLIVTSSPDRVERIFREGQKIEGGGWKNIWITDKEALQGTPFLSIPWREGKNGKEVSIEKIIRDAFPGLFQAKE